MKFEEAMKLLKEGKKIYLCTPCCLVKERIYYIDEHKRMHKVIFDDDEQKWYDSWQFHIEINSEFLFNDNWKEYNGKEDNRVKEE